VQINELNTAMAACAGTSLGGTPRPNQLRPRVVMYIDGELPRLSRPGSNDIVKVASCALNKQWGTNPTNQLIINAYKMYIDGTHKSRPDVEDFIENNSPVEPERVIQCRTLQAVGPSGPLLLQPPAPTHPSSPGIAPAPALPPPLALVPGPAPLTTVKPLVAPVPVDQPCPRLVLAPPTFEPSAVPTPGTPSPPAAVLEDSAAEVPIDPALVMPMAQSGSTVSATEHAPQWAERAFVKDSPWTGPSPADPPPELVQPATGTPSEAMETAIEGPGDAHDHGRSRNNGNGGRGGRGRGSRGRGRAAVQASRWGRGSDPGLAQNVKQGTAEDGKGGDSGTGRRATRSRPA
jgi:hypothetical protein